MLFFSTTYQMILNFSQAPVNVLSIRIINSFFSFFDCPKWLILTRVESIRRILRLHSFCFHPIFRFAYSSISGNDAVSPRTSSSSYPSRVSHFCSHVIPTCCADASSASRRRFTIAQCVCEIEKCYLTQDSAIARAFRFTVRLYRAVPRLNPKVM